MVLGRLIAYALGWKDFESCKGCEILKQQLDIANQEKAEAINTILEIVKPKAVVDSVAEAQIQQPLVPVNTVPVGNWARRRAALEERDRQAARIKAQGQFSAVPDREIPEQAKENAEAVEALEKEIERMESSNAR